MPRNQVRQQTSDAANQNEGGRFDLQSSLVQYLSKLGRPRPTQEYAVNYGHVAQHFVAQQIHSGAHLAPALLNPAHRFDAAVGCANAARYDVGVRQLCDCGGETVWKRPTAPIDPGPMTSCAAGVAGVASAEAFGCRSKSVTPVAAPMPPTMKPTVERVPSVW